MHALAAQGIKVRGQGRHQCLAFTGTHLGNFAVMQHHAANQLHIEMTHAQRTLAGFANGGEGFGQQIVQGFTFTVAFLEFVRLGQQLGVAQLFYRRFECVDRQHAFAILLEQAFVTAAKDGLQEIVEHEKLS